jgi:hypothetical protein
MITSRLPLIAQVFAELNYGKTKITRMFKDMKPLGYVL